MFLAIVALVLLAAEVVYDSFTTLYLLAQGGTEANPVARWLQKYAGVYGAGVVGWLVSAATLLINHWIIWVIIAVEGINVYYQHQKYSAAKGN